MVWVIAEIMVKALFKAGHNVVIVDATNNTAKRRVFWERQLGNTARIEPEIFNASAEECIKRARLIDDEEIIPVIERMDAESDWRKETKEGR